jgi:thiamine biosynthesis lipoprotein
VALSLAESSATFRLWEGTAVVVVADPDVLKGAETAVRNVVARIDRACSRFRDDSELSAVNEAAGRPVEVSPLMLSALDAALRAARLTDGDVDPTVGRALLALEAEDEAGRSRAPRIAAVPGWQAVTINRARSTVTLAKGVVLDLGATAKALAADLAAREACRVSGSGVLVSLGGDISIAGAAPEEGWSVRVTDDHRADATAPGQTITIRSGGLATSSTTVRRWQTSSGAVHHLLDPRTGRPATEVWRTVSVTAGSCLDANIASTAAIVRGHRAVEWLEGLGLPSRLIGIDGTVRHLAGWPSEGDDLPPSEGDDLPPSEGDDLPPSEGDDLPEAR